MPWLATGLLLASGFCWVTGVPFAGPLLIASGAALAAGLVLLIMGALSPAPSAQEAGSPPVAPRPHSPMLAVLTIVMALVILLVGFGRGLSSAPTSQHDMNFQGVALLAGFIVLVLGAIALAAPAFRARAVLVGLAVVIGLIVYDWGLG